VERLRGILRELDELQQAVGQSRESVTVRRADLLEEGFRLLAEAIIELGQHEDDR